MINFLKEIFKTFINIITFLQVLIFNQKLSIYSLIYFFIRAEEIIPNFTTIKLVPLTFLKKNLVLIYRKININKI
jgi:hypothetical protein